MKVFKVMIKGHNAVNKDSRGDDDAYLIIAKDFQSAGKIGDHLCNTGQIEGITYFGEVFGQAEYPILKAKDHWVLL